MRIVAGSNFASASKRSRAGLAVSSSPSASRQSKKKTLKGYLARNASTSSLRPEAAHGFLERVGRALGLERDRFAVENQLARGALVQRRDDLGHGGGDFVQAPRIDADFAARLVRLHARAVELPLEGRAAEALQRDCARVCRFSDNRSPT